MRSLLTAAAVSLDPGRIVSIWTDLRSRRTRLGCHRPSIRLRGLLGALLATVLSACVGPQRQIEHLAQAAGFQEEIVAGQGFRHRIYRRPGPLHNGTLHVYIEGDGRPFLTPTTVALDPTPRDPLMLRLMALDPAPSLYLGRPCYLGLTADAGCGPEYWTVRRFAPEVLDSLASVLRTEMERSGATRIELYGHSGGGALAVLLASRFPEADRVVTIGANLDTAAWCALHGYTPLLGSLNPAGQSAHPRSAHILHLVGSDDTNIPPALLESAATQATPGSTVRVIHGYTHGCCWQQIWKGVLAESAG